MCVWVRAFPAPCYFWLGVGACALLCAPQPFAGGPSWGCLWRGVMWGSPWAEFLTPPFFFRSSWLRGGVCWCGSWPCRVVALWWLPLSVPVISPLVSAPPPPFRVAGGPPLLWWGVRQRVRGALPPSHSAAVWLWWAAAFGWVSLGWAGCSPGVLLGGARGRRLWRCLAEVAARFFWSGCAASRLCDGLLLFSFFPGGRQVRVCGWVGVPPPPFFCWRGVCLFLPLSSLGWCTHWLAFGVANRVPAGVLSGCKPCPGPMGRVGYVHAWPGGLCYPVRCWCCWLGSCASRFREVMG